MLIPCAPVPLLSMRVPTGRERTSAVRQGTVLHVVEDKIVALPLLSEILLGGMANGAPLTPKQSPTWRRTNRICRGQSPSSSGWRAGTHEPPSQAGYDAGRSSRRERPHPVFRRRTTRARFQATLDSLEPGQTQSLPPGSTSKQPPYEERDARRAPRTFEPVAPRLPDARSGGVIGAARRACAGHPAQKPRVIPPLRDRHRGSERGRHRRSRRPREHRSKRQGEGSMDEAADPWRSNVSVPSRRWRSTYRTASWPGVPTTASGRHSGSSFRRSSV